MFLNCKTGIKGEVLFSEYSETYPLKMLRKSCYVLAQIYFVLQIQGSGKAFPC